MADDVTLGEVFRRLTSVESKFDAGITRVGDRIDRLESINREIAVLASKGDRLEARVAELEEDRKWTRRALLTSLLLPVIVGLVLAVLMLQP